MRLIPALALVLPALLGVPASLPAQRPATRAAYIDGAGVMRWKDDRTEVALFGLAPRSKRGSKKPPLKPSE